MKIYLVLFLSSLTFCGCVTGTQVVYKTEYKDVYTPVACIDKMPDKPEYDPARPFSAKELAQYFKTCEELLQGCVK